MSAATAFADLWEPLLPVGRDPGTGGYRRFSWTAADRDCRAWFEAAARERQLRTGQDRNGNLWAWWDVAGPAPGGAPAAVATGSHLDSVPDGGAYDGPLGVVSAFAAIDELRAGGFVPVRPIAVAAFTEEEGARFGVACLGSRLCPRRWRSSTLLGPERLGRGDRALAKQDRLKSIAASSRSGRIWP